MEGRKMKEVFLNFHKNFGYSIQVKRLPNHLCDLAWLILNARFSLKGEKMPKYNKTASESIQFKTGAFYRSSKKQYCFYYCTVTADKKKQRWI